MLGGRDPYVDHSDADSSQNEGEKMKYQSYLFDLDGTLTDPGLGIKNSIRYALEQYGLPSLQEGILDCFVGPPLLDSFEQYCHVTREESYRLLSLYREYFSEKGIYENHLYEGVEETLKELCEQEARIYLATSKPEPFAKRILSHFDIERYFTFVGGSTMEETRTAKDEVIAYVLSEAKVPVESAVMVGDRVYDIRGGRKNGLATVGVLYGYGDRAELSEADHLITAIHELLLL